jgi:uncharacterized membrane protein
MLKLTLLLILAIIGAGITIYLIHSRLTKKKVMCKNNTCQVVLESKYNKILGINNDILGLLYYILILVEFFLLTNLMTNMLFYFKAISTVAFLGSVYLLYLQVVVLKKYCPYCIVSAIINLGIFGIIISL